MSRKIKGVFLTSPNEVEIREFEEPPFPHQAVLTRTLMCGICGTDVHMYLGTVPIVQPIGLGHEWVGIVEEIGEKANALDVWGEQINRGDRITVAGSPQGCGKCVYCKFYQMPWLHEQRGPFEEPRRKEPVELTAFHVGGYGNYKYVFPGSWIYKIPEDLPTEIAVLIEPFSTALHVGRFVEREGLVVAIQGSGPIGLLSVMAAKLSGAWKVVVVGAPEQRLKLCEEFGADYTVNIEELTSSEERVEAVKKLTRGEAGADLTVEAAGVPAAFVEGISMTRRGGTYLEMGHWTNRGAVDVNPYLICWKNINIHGLYGYGSSQFEYSIRVLSRYRDQFPLHKAVTHRFKIEEAKEALETARLGKCMKAVIEP